MRPLIFAAVGVLVLVASPGNSHGYGADELLSSCSEADNDARWGEVAELECEQYILGFIDALRVTGDTSVCAPELNTADEVRWAFMRWVHEDFSARKSLDAGPALMSALKEKFACS